MGIGCALRIVLAWLMPLAAVAAKLDPGGVVLSLSVVATVVEVLVSACCRPGVTSKDKRQWRSMRQVPLQFGVLYSLQVWWLCLHVVSSRDEDAAFVAEPGTPDATPAAAADHGFLSNAGRNEVESKPDVSTATLEGNAVGSGFDLDAPLETLRWTPATLSVVLPCAEEGDFAVKTVKSVFNSVPPELLYEIVVVDDGSEPPLAHTHMPRSMQEQYKVKMMRHPRTIGLIGSKKTGGDGANGDIIVFFDCHVAPQPNWYKDFFDLIGENYRRMVVPSITNLNIDTWTQERSGAGVSKCYVTWDGDFKWGGEDDMYMAMISGGLAGLSRRWWIESGGYDDQMFGWGGENIDQGIRMWVCGGEIVAAPNSQVAHMWRVGDRRTHARYRHVGDATRNRGRAIYAWFGEFTAKLNDFPGFASRRSSQGDGWVGNMSSFQRVKDSLNGCRPFAWYLRRFKGIYEDAGLLPPEIFMIKEESTGMCIHFQGHAGTSASGNEGVDLAACDSTDHRLFWHLGNKDPRTGRCCSGLRAWNTEQCFSGGQPGGKKAITRICEILGRDIRQHWALTSTGQLKHQNTCIGPGSGRNTLAEVQCNSLTGKQWRFTKAHVSEPLETRLYRMARHDHPEVFKVLDEQLAKMDAAKQPMLCRGGASCVTLVAMDGSGRCLDGEGQLVSERNFCAPLVVESGGAVKLADSGTCLDNWSDDDAETWGFYGCHGGSNQHFSRKSSDQVCVITFANHEECFETHEWPWSSSS